MEIEVWYDYICPWCYLALDRVAHLEGRYGASVTWQPFELHPDWPASGMEAPRYERAGLLGDLVERSALPFTGRRTVTNSLDALSLSAGLSSAESWGALHRRLFAAYWVENRSLGDRSVLLDVAGEFGISPEAATQAMDEGTIIALASKERALELGIAATPGWHFGNGVVFPGVHEPAVFDRIIARLGRD